MSEPVKLKLTKPIEAWGKEVHELSFKEPTGGTIVRCGLPQFYENRDGATFTRVDTRVVEAMIAELALIPTSSVKELSVRDFAAATGVITGFFEEPRRKSSGEDMAASPDSTKVPNGPSA